MKIKYICSAIFIFMIIIVCATALLIYNGTVLLNNPSEAEYPVRGADVSLYQGDIDWQTLSTQNIDFAFIKATEGSSFTDPCFEYNYDQARKCGISVGFYHFFSYDSKGITQAQNYIDTVVPFEGMLPPVVNRLSVELKNHMAYTFSADIKAEKNL